MIKFDRKFLLQTVIPFLSKGSRGKSSELDLVEVVRAIFHRLKTGCQWRELPIKQYISRPDTTWEAIYYHYNKWCKDNSWYRVWLNATTVYQQYLDLSCVALDGSHTRAYRGGQCVGYNGRKAANTTNMLYIIDNQGVILFCSQPISGEHHDLFNIKEHFGQIEQMAQDMNIDLNGLFLNADGGFDSFEFRQLLDGKYIQANIAINKRNTKLAEVKDYYFDETLYAKRKLAEHPFAWMDGFKAMLVRYEKLAVTWFSMNIMTMFHIFMKKISKHIKIEMQL